MPGHVQAGLRVTWLSVAVNLVLTAAKLATGVLAQSQAMVADGVHSLSDFLTDFAVLAGLRIAARPRDRDHAYGHGKFTPLTAVFIGIVLAGVGLEIGATAMRKIFDALNGVAVRPGAAAFWMALVSIAAKEALFRVTLRTGRASGNPALIANAWHHRSDAFSSIATAAGIGAAVFLGDNWRVLDPIAALLVCLVLLKTAWTIVRSQIGSLTDQGMGPAVEKEILAIAAAIPGVSAPHNLRTRQVGDTVVIDLHVRVSADMTVATSHAIATRLEDAYAERFGADTIANIHIEPVSE